jgi:Reverse transcriptase (RNA-dependent DNA polymerase)
MNRKLILGEEYSDGELDVDFTSEEIGKAIGQLPNGKAAPGIVNELIKAGGQPMLNSVTRLFNKLWTANVVPKGWGEGVIINLFKKGETENTDNYRGITLLGAMRKLFCRVLNNRLMGHLHKDKLHEAQAGFRPGMSCEDHIFTLSQVIQGRRRGEQKTYAFFLDVKKAYDSVWRGGLWHKLWELGIKGRMLRTIVSLYASTRSRVLVNGEMSEPFDIEKGVAQGCTLSCTLFDAFVNDLLVELDESGFGVEVGEKTIHSLMFADDFIGLEQSPERLANMMQVIERWCNRWGLEANVAKCAIVVFSGQEGDKDYGWTWGGELVPVRNSYTYLGVEFNENCKWDDTADSMLKKGNRAVDKYYKLLKAKDLPVPLKKTILVTAIRPTLEYGGGVVEPNKKQYARFETVQLKAAKCIMQCAVSTPSVAVRGDLGLETLEERRELAKLKWWFKVIRMEENRYPKLAYEAVWPKLKKGGDIKSWGKAVKQLVNDLNVNEEEVREWTPKAFAEWAKKRIRERHNARELRMAEMKERRKVDAYNSLEDKLELQTYLKGPLTLGAKLKFKFRAGSHGLGEETGRRAGVNREDRVCEFCCCGVESVAHFCWECPIYDAMRMPFLAELETCIGHAQFADLMACDVEKRTSMILSHVRWGEVSESVDKVLQKYLVDAWVTRCSHKYKEKSFYKDMNVVCTAVVRREVYGQLTTAGNSEADN